jgi:hypothetical protein
MAFSLNEFLSNLNGSGGPAKSSLFEVVIPVPVCIGNFAQSSDLDNILSLPNSIFTDITSAINEVLSNVLGDSATSSPASISRYLSLQCESANLPGKRLDTVDVKIYGPTFKVPYKVNYDVMTLTFLCTNLFQERQLFDKWLECIMPTDTNNFRFPKGDSGYMTDITITQFDDSGNEIYGVQLLDAFPFDIGQQPLNWDSHSFHRLSVQFAYQKFKTIYN